jgi:hypothetical protein
MRSRDLAATSARQSPAPAANVGLAFRAVGLRGFVLQDVVDVELDFLDTRTPYRILIDWPAEPLKWVSHYTVRTAAFAKSSEPQF